LQGSWPLAGGIYRRFSAGGSATYLSQGSAISTTKASIIFNTGTMRITPTTLDYSGINVVDGAIGFSSTAASLIAATSSPDIAQVRFYGLFRFDTVSTLFCTSTKHIFLYRI